MADTADIVVVGGGIMGMSLALHLLQAGARNVRLLERDGLFEGTTSAGAGFLAPWSVMTPRHGAESKMLPIELYGLRFYADLQAAGYDIDYRRNGVLWVTASEGRWIENKDQPWLAADPDSSELGPDEITELTGGVVLGDRVRGALHLPNGAQITPVKVGAALAHRITELGGVIETRRPVTGLRVHGRRTLGVDTPAGQVDCGTVVIAAGAWSSALLSEVGFFLPTFPQITSRIITDPIGIPETMPTLMLLGTLPDEPEGGTILWARCHNGGLLWGGVYTTHPRNILVDAPVPDRFDDLPLDGVLEDQRVGRAASYMPALSQPTSIRIKHGAPCYTPDEMALVGPVPGVDGLYALAGDNELGITQGPGYGKALAEQIARGSSDFVDLYPWRLDRFGDRFRNQAQTMDGLAASFEALMVGDTA
jgi:glycine/D-amino acid oxidase-like deaminating enzyme